MCARPVDKLEQMLGSYGINPTGEPYVKNFNPEESPSGMLARLGMYHVRSRVFDDDGEVNAGESYRVILKSLLLKKITIRLGMVF